MWIDIEFEAKFYQRNGAEALATKLNELRIQPGTFVLLHDDKGRVFSAIGWQVPETHWSAT